MSIGQSPSQTVGPMYGFALGADGLDRSVDPGAPGAITIRGVVLDGIGEPIAYPDAFVEVWQGDQFTRGRTDPFGVWTVYIEKPQEVQPLSDGTPQAPHMHVTVWARGLLKQAQTRLYFPDEAEANAADPVLGYVAAERRDLLIARAEPDGSLRFDIELQGDREMVFFEF